MGEYTNIDILLGNHLSSRAVQTKLIPRLGSFVGVIEEKLNLAMDYYYPSSRGASPTCPRRSTLLVFQRNFSKYLRRSMGNSRLERCNLTHRISYHGLDLRWVPSVLERGVAVSQHPNCRGDISHCGSNETFPAVLASNHQHLYTVKMEAVKLHATYSYSSCSSN